MAKIEGLTNNVEISRVQSVEIVVVDFAKPQIPVEKPEKVNFPLIPNPFPDKRPEQTPVRIPARPVNEPIPTRRIPVPAHR